MFDWLSKKIDNILVWIVKTIEVIFTALFDFLNYVFVTLLDLLMSAVATLIKAIQVPQFMSNGLDQLFSMLPDWLNFFFSVTGLPAALTLVGAGVAFRLLRKVFTLGQW